MMNSVLTSPLLLGLRTFLTPLEAAEALSGTQAPDSRVTPIFEAAWPLLKEDEPLPKDRAGVIDAFRKMDPEKWKAILRPNRQAIFDQYKRFQPSEGIAELLIKDGPKSEIRERRDRERWIFYDHNLLFNPESGEILQISKQEKGLAQKLRGKRLGSIIDPPLLPEKIRVSTVVQSPYLFSNNPDFRKLAHSARHYLHIASDKNLVLYYGGEQWTVADFCVTGAIMLCNANAPERSGFPEDYRILGSNDPVEPYFFGPFVPAVRVRSISSPANYLTGPLSHMDILFRTLFGGRESVEEKKLGRLPPFIFAKDQPVLVEEADTEEDQSCFVIYKGDCIITLTAPSEFFAEDDGPKFTTIPTPKMIADALDTVPKSLLEGLEEIKIMNEVKPNTAANCGEGTMRFFKRPEAPMHRLEMRRLTQATLWHELGHHIAQYRFGDSDMKNHCGWLKAMQKDGNSPSRYAQTNRAEDFAETVSLYFLTNGGFSDDSRERHPNRFAFLDELFWDVLKPSAKRKLSTVVHS